MRALAFEHLRPNPIGVYGDVLDGRGIGVDRVMLDEGEAIPDWRAYDFLVVMGAGGERVGPRQSIPGSRPRRRRSARRCSPASRISACASARSCSRRPSARTATAGWRPSSGSTRCSSPRRPVATRCSAASRPTSTSASGIPTTSRCRRARSGLPGRRATRTRPSGSAGSRTASSVTSRRRARTSRLGSSCSPRPWACSSRGTAPDRCRPSSTTTARSCRACARPRDSSSDVGWRTRWRSATWRARCAHCGRCGRDGAEPARGLIGRDSERARIESALTAARQGGSAVIVVRGEAGAGKTALLDDAVARARGLRVLRTRGADPDGEQRFAGLAELCEPLLGQLAAPARRAGGGARLRARPRARRARAVDRYAVYAGMLDLLTAAAEETPILVVVDDAHLLDEASAEAIPFIARRLRIDGIALLIATESDDGLSDAEELRLGPLDPAHARALLSARFGGELAPSVVGAHRRERAGQPARAAGDRARPHARAAPRGGAARRVAAALGGVGVPAPDRGAARRHAPGAAACRARRGRRARDRRSGMHDPRPRPDGARRRGAGRARRAGRDAGDVLPRARAHRRLLLGAGRRAPPRARRAGRRGRRRAAPLAPGPRRHRPRRRGRRRTRAGGHARPATRAPTRPRPTLSSRPRA